MKIYIEKDNRSLNFTKKDIEKHEIFTGKILLEKLHINSATVLIVKNDEVVLEDEILEENDDIKILSVISGG